jgi:hypothetical protein
LPASAGSIRQPDERLSGDAWSFSCRRHHLVRALGKAGEKQIHKNKSP